MNEKKNVSSLVLFLVNPPEKRHQIEKSTKQTVLECQMDNIEERDNETAI